MPFLFPPLYLFVAVLVEYVRKQQDLVIEYLLVENQILREQIRGKRVLLTDDQRRVLAVKGKALGRKRLGKIATVAQADTILRWHRELIRPAADSRPSSKMGRPRTNQEVADLVLRMAHDNASWGYKRIEGALHNLGYSICSSTVANILKKHGIEPAPSRQRTMSWSTFLKAHWDVFEGLDLATVTLWLGELARFVFGRVSNDQPTHCITVAKSDDETPSPSMFTIYIPQVPDTAFHPARAPPIRPDTIPSISPRELRRAA